MLKMESPRKMSLFMASAAILVIMLSEVPGILTASTGVTGDFIPTLDQVDECAKDDYSMPAVNSTTGEVECYALTTQGPCDNGDDWFVLGNSVSPDGLPLAQCVKRDCDSSFQVQYKGKCYTLHATSVCEDGEELLINPQGKGTCVCKFIPWTHEDGKIKCYKEYFRGPCPEGQQLSLHWDTKEPECIESNCRPGYIRHNNGLCYKGNEFTCGPESEVLFNDEFRTIECLTVLRDLLVLPENCPPGKEDFNGKCVTVRKSGQVRPTRKLAMNTKNLASYLRRRRQSKGETGEEEDAEE